MDQLFPQREDQLPDSERTLRNKRPCRLATEPALPVAAVFDAVFAEDRRAGADLLVGGALRSEEPPRLAEIEDAVQPEDGQRLPGEVFELRQFRFQMFQLFHGIDFLSC